MAQNKGKRHYSGRKGKATKSFKPENKKDENIPDHNDWTFYAASEEIAKGVASLPFNYLGGTTFPLTAFGQANKSDEIETVTNQYALPAIMNLRYVNSIGVTNTRTQGVNMAATQLYTYIRHANSGAKVYEAADVMMYVLAMLDVYSEFFEIKKIIGTARLYNYYNHNLPNGLLAMMRIDPDDLRSNLAQYNAQLNVYAHKINSFAVPNCFKAFDRKAYINSFIFTDSESIRGQFYNFYKDGYYVWSGISSETGTTLQFNRHILDYPGSEEVIPLSTRFEHLDAMLNALFLDSDALTISGDILKAFGEGSLYKLAQTDIEYQVSVAYNVDLLSQIQNSNAVDPVSSIPSADSEQPGYLFDITQNDQLITFNPSIQYVNNTDPAQPYVMRNYILNSVKETPDYKDVLEWTRLMSSYDVAVVPNGDTDKKLEVSISSTGLEFVLYYEIFKYSGVDNTYKITPFSSVLARNLISINEAANFMDVSQFAHHPFIYKVDAGNKEISVLGELKVQTIVDRDTLDKINDAAIYGALYANNLYK